MLLNRLRGPSLAVLTCALGALSLSACATTGGTSATSSSARAKPAGDPENPKTKIAKDYFGFFVR